MRELALTNEDIPIAVVLRPCPIPAIRVWILHHTIVNLIPNVIAAFLRFYAKYRDPEKQGAATNGLGSNMLLTDWNGIETGRYIVRLWAFDMGFESAKMPKLDSEKQLIECVIFDCDFVTLVF
eukprot:scaffold9935_cov134-Cylindrotheca_fusiformis.AAC.2